MTIRFVIGVADIMAKGVCTTCNGKNTKHRKMTPFKDNALAFKTSSVTR